jgi:hypothetical protein
MRRVQVIEDSLQNISRSRDFDIEEEKVPLSDQSRQDSRGNEIDHFLRNITEESSINPSPSILQDRKDERPQLNLG